MANEVKLFIQFEKDTKFVEGLNTHTHTHLPLLAFFRQYRDNEIRDKHKTKFMGESYFLMFRRPQNNVFLFTLYFILLLYVFLFTFFIGNAKLRFYWK